MSKEKYYQIIDEVYEKYHQENKHVMYLTFLLREEFINKIKKDKGFSEKWGLKIEERELSLKEKADWLNINYPLYELGKWNIEKLSDKDYSKQVELEYNIPTKLITITYNNEKTYCYE